MFIFRLISFGIRLVSAFIFTLILQIQWDGKSLESYLVRFGKKMVVMKTLNQVGQDGVTTIRSLTSSGGPEKKQLRDVANHLEPTIQKIKSKLVLPDYPLEEKNKK